MNDFLHTWEFDEKSWLIRFYKFWYIEPDLDTLSFCKLFWAVMCAPLMGVAWIVLLPVFKILEWLDNRQDAKIRRSNDSNDLSVSTRSKNKATAMAEAVGSFFDRIAAFFQRHELLGKTLMWSTIILAGIAAGGGSIYGLIRLIALIHGNFYWHVWWPIIQDLLYFLLWVGGVIAIVCFIMFGIGDGNGNVRPGLRSVGRFFATGYHAVKYRTCPKVVVRSKS